MINEQQPLVSCIMPTYNRREFVPHAIRYFLRQDYENKELIIIDDGTDAVKDLVPEHQNIKYLRLEHKISLGAKLNLACKHASGKLIANWDDDDWYSDRRLKYQVDHLKNGDTDVCGINNLLYYDLRKKDAHQYIYPPDQRVWLLGSSLCYTKDYWKANNYADINVGMDALFVWGTPASRVTVLPDHTFSVHMIHEHNVSPKKTDGAWWHHYAVDEIRKLMEIDWAYYHDGYSAEVKKSINGYVSESVKTAQTKPLKNIYACLVHENEDCIIDIVRNLHYNDPASAIILYNGSENPALMQKKFPYDKYGAVLHPEPAPVKHGYLHQYALSSMQFALDNFSFDTFTIVDSDQLAIRPGYSEYMGRFFAARSNIGVLSSRPERITEADDDVWTSIQAYKEYDLWKPFLQKFEDGENKFVHWTFWPSTVFTADAVHDLTAIFGKNKQLQDIMNQTQIWATEEIILPTLVKLMGYDIAANPCSYEYVKYQKTYDINDMNAAADKKEAYWVHPVERKYDNFIRKHARQTQQHYTVSKSNPAVVAPAARADLFLTQPLLTKVKQIEGWLGHAEADLLIAAAMKVCTRKGPHTIVETGSYHGKSTVIFGSVIRAFSPGSKIYAVDLHDGVVGSADDGFATFPASLPSLKRNLEDCGLAGFVEIIEEKPCTISWEKPISLLFIDGLHDYPNVSKEFWNFSDSIIWDGLVAFHDYANYYPGVQSFVNELLASGGYRKTGQAESLIVLEKL